MTGTGSRDCPECGTELYSHTSAPGVQWCESCEREFWKQDGDWYSCDESGVHERV